MLLIPCPWCGERSESEFTYIRASHAERPDTSQLEQDQSERLALLDYVYLRDNPKGWTKEHWQHTGGCRGIFAVERHNVTHEIRGSAKPGEPLPSEDSQEGEAQ